MTVARPEIVTRGARTEPTGWLAWLTTHRPQADRTALLLHDLRLLPGRGALGAADPHRADGAGADGHGPADLQRALHRAWRVMIFLFIIPVISGSFGNLVMPIQIGARDVSFPRLNLLSWWLYMIGAVIILTSLFTGGGPPDTGWTFYAPLRAPAPGPAFPGGLRGLHRRLLVDPDRGQLRHHHPPTSGPWDELGAPAALRLVALRHCLGADPGHADPGHHPGADRGRTAARRRPVRPGPGR